MGCVHRMLRDSTRHFKMGSLAAYEEWLQRLMNQYGILAKAKLKFVETTDAKRHLPVAPNVLQPKFNPYATGVRTKTWTIRR
jgi:hypothetical protein